MPKAPRVTGADFRHALAGAALLLAGCSGGHSAPRAGSNAPLAQRLARADADHGAHIFWQCAACHALRPGGADGDGPNLWGVLGRPIAGHPGSVYSAGLKAVGGVWTCARLDLWLTHPQGFAPGTIMGFPGLPDGADRADVIAWLAQNGGAPAAARCQGLTEPRAGG